MNRDELIDHAYAIAEEYVDQGLTLTLRQLYFGKLDVDLR